MYALEVFETEEPGARAREKTNETLYRCIEQQQRHSEMTLNTGALEAMAQLWVLRLLFAKKRFLGLRFLSTW